MTTVFFSCSALIEASCRCVYRHREPLPLNAHSCRRLIGYKSPGSQPGRDCGPQGLLSIFPVWSEWMNTLINKGLKLYCLYSAVFIHHIVTLSATQVHSKHPTTMNLTSLQDEKPHFSFFSFCRALQFCRCTKSIVKKLLHHHCISSSDIKCVLLDNVRRKRMGGSRSETIQTVHLHRRSRCSRVPPEPPVGAI